MYKSFASSLLLIFLGIIICPQLLIADYGGSFIYIGCDKKNNSFEIEPLIIWNEDYDLIYPTIERESGIVKRDNYQLFEIESHPGFDVTCSLDETEIRVIKQKWKNKLDIYVNNQLTITSNPNNYLYGVFKAWYTKSSGWKVLDTKKEISSKNSVLNKLLHDKSLQQKPMLYQTIKSTSEVCAFVQKNLNSTFLKKDSTINNLLDGHSDKGEFILSDGKTRKSFTSSSLFDFDNDGIVDKIFSYYGAGSYILGTILYVSYGDKNETINKKDKLTIKDIKIFPCQFDKSVKKSSSCPTISQDADEAGISVSFGSGENIFFRGRYTSMIPFKYKNKTYLILRSSSWDTKNSAAVIYPYSKTNFKPVCLFKRQP